MKDIMAKLKLVEGGNRNVLREILAGKLPQFTTYVEMLRPNELLVIYGVPVQKIKPFEKT